MPGQEGRGKGNDGGVEENWEVGEEDVKAEEVGRRLFLKVFVLGIWRVYRFLDLALKGRNL